MNTFELFFSNLNFGVSNHLLSSCTEQPTIKAVISLIKTIILRICRNQHTRKNVGKTTFERYSAYYFPLQYFCLFQFVNKRVSLQIIRMWKWVLPKRELARSGQIGCHILLILKFSLFISPVFLSIYRFKLSQLLRKTDRRFSNNICSDRSHFQTIEEKLHRNTAIRCT